MVKTLTSLRRERGMTSLQAVILLGGGFLVAWGLMELFEANTGAARENAALTIAGGFKRPQGGVGGRGAAPGGGGNGGGDTGSGNDPPGPGKLPNAGDLTVEPRETTFEVPEHGRLTDDEIGEAQSDSDWWWGLEHLAADAGIIPGPLDSHAIVQAGIYTPPGLGWVFGPTIRERAEAFAERYSREPGEWNALQHTYWQAQLAFHYGPATAQAIGDKHESLQQYGNAQRRRDSAADLFNNQVGRAIGAQVRAEADGPSGADPDFDPNQRMMHLIVVAIRDGRLDLGGGVGSRAGVQNPRGQDGLRRNLGIEPRPLQVPNPFWKG